MINMKKNSDDENLKTRYDNITMRPETWLFKATDLIYAANILKEHEEFLKDGRSIAVYMMLNSFAIENLIKCIYIQKNSDMVKDGELIKKGHNLLKMFKDAKINYTQSEEDLLNRLYHSVEIGRYSIPKTFGEFKEWVKNPKGRFYNDNVKDMNNIVDIINKFKGN